MTTTLLSMVFANSLTSSHATKQPQGRRSLALQGLELLLTDSSSWMVERRELTFRNRAAAF